ncbi:MAG: OmpA family protein [Alphaproteobacteria bacterium]|nr:OmpA family protein [Alphaproteobacteria bacterium]
MMGIDAIRAGALSSSFNLYAGYFDTHGDPEKDRTIHLEKFPAPNGSESVRAFWEDVNETRMVYHRIGPALESETTIRIPAGTEPNNVGFTKKSAEESAFVRRYGNKQSEPYQHNQGYETITFDLDKSEIRPEFGERLDRVAAYLKANPTARVDITGHTDKSGSDKYNMGLSKARMEATRDYLSEKGIPLAQMKFTGDYRGENNPAVSTPDGIAMEANRRVEIGFVYNDPALNPKVVQNYLFTEDSAADRHFSSALKNGSGALGEASFTFDGGIHTPLRTYLSAENIYDQRFYIQNSEGLQAVGARFDPDTKELTLMKTENGMAQPIAIIEIETSGKIDPAKLKIGVLGPGDQETPIPLSANQLIRKIDLETRGAAMSIGAAPVQTLGL